MVTVKVKDFHDKEEGRITRSTDKGDQAITIYISEKHSKSGV
jgi:hypothetical protein